MEEEKGGEREKTKKKEREDKTTKRWRSKGWEKGEDEEVEVIEEKDFISYIRGLEAVSF